MELMRTQPNREETSGEENDRNYRKSNGGRVCRNFSRKKMPLSCVS